MKFGGPLSKKPDCIQVRADGIKHGRRQILPVSSDGSLMLEHGPKRPSQVLPYVLPVTGQGFQCELPRISDIRHKGLQDPQTHLAVVFAFVVYPPSDRGNVREVFFFREKASNLQVRIVTFGRAAEKLQNYPITIDDRTVALFRLDGLGLQNTRRGPAKNMKCVSTRCVDFTFEPTKHSFLLNHFEKTMQKLVVCKRISQMQIGATRGAVHFQSRLRAP